MSKKANTKNGAKPKKSKPEQLKIKGTEREDSIPELEEQANAYLEARNAWQSMQAEMMAEQEKLTALLTGHKLKEYIFEDESGQPQRAYIPDVAGAKVKKLKAKKTDEEAGA